MHPHPAIVEGDLAAEPGPIRLVRLRLTLALIAMAFLPIALAAPILSTALDSQRAIEQSQADRDAATVSSDLAARLNGASTALVRTGSSTALAAYAGGSKNGLPAARAALVALTGDIEDPTVVATLLDTRGRQLLRAVGGRLATPGATTAVDPLVGAALDAGRGAVESDLIASDATTASRLALATPVIGGTRSTPVGIVRLEISLDRFLQLAGRGQIAGGAARLVDSTGAVLAPAGRPNGSAGATINASSALAWRAGWTVRLAAPTRLAPPPLPLIGLLGLFVLVLGILVAWMARQILRPAEELEASRGRLRDMYELARGDSLRDVLTGLGNHRAFQEAFQRQVDAAKTAARVARARPHRPRRFPGGQRRRRACRRRPGPGRVRPGRRREHAFRRPRLPDRRRRVRPAASRGRRPRPRRPSRGGSSPRRSTIRRARRPAPARSRPASRHSRPRRPTAASSSTRPTRP